MAETWSDIEVKLAFKTLKELREEQKLRREKTNYSEFSPVSDNLCEKKSNEDNSKVAIPKATVHGSSEEFSNDILTLLNDAYSSDITIKSGNDIFKVHKNILSARSPVFKAMFSNSMREKVEGVVSIDDIDSEIVRDLMSFIYGNKVQNLCVPKACDLLNAAEKYQLNSLKTICLDYLKSSLSLENAFFILQKADLYDKNLKMCAMKFTRENFSDLKATEEWKNVQSRNPTLALEVFNVVVDHLTGNN